MPVVEDVHRLDVLRRLGLSDPLVRQSSGEQLHPLFWFRCQGPPWYSYHGAGCPEGPPLMPLWDKGDTVTAAWVKDGRLEFIEFGIEWSDEYVVLAHTEQGLWATVFVLLLEDEDSLELEDFREPAWVVRFRFLDRLVYGRDGGTQTFEEHRAWLREVVEGIDRETRGPEPPSQHGRSRMAVTRDEAARLALEVANQTWGYPNSGEELVILDDHVAESESAWAFTYNTRSFVLV
ncbi:MAG: hypothetical protein JWO38_1374 [Gemmataceae bacterium]|nr:hypothetical protein [Gemmataceae bacterium]